MINLSMWHRTTLNGNVKEWEEYILAFDDVSGDASRTYFKGVEEKFGDVYNAARRVAQIRTDKHVGEVYVSSGFHYVPETNKIVNGQAYIPLDNGKVRINRPLSEEEMNSFSNEVLRVLSGK